MGCCRVAFLVCAVVGSTAAAHAGETRAVIELFTSQGCSSCPEADQLLGQLANDPGVVAMSLPIDYWDYLGWKDTLAKPAHSARQRAYAAARGDRAVYTPQVVVNGTVHVQGSDKAAIERAIVQTHQQPGTLALPVSVAIENGRVIVKVPAAGEGRQAGSEARTATSDSRAGGEVWLYALTNSVPVAIGRGENRGRTVTYYNVVRHGLKLGEWNGTARSFSVPVADIDPDTANRVAVLVQAGKGDTPGRIVGASEASLR
jgi:hypothetical protein